MSLYPFFRPRQFSALEGLLQDLGHVERQMNRFDWPGVALQNPSSLTNEITDDEKKFAINLDVKQFKPEDLKIDLDGRKLTIEGKQEVKSENGYSKRSFSRIIVLPDDVDSSSIVSSITKEGKLSIEASKKEVIKGRNIPIQQVQNPNPAVEQQSNKLK